MTFQAGVTQKNLQGLCRTALSDAVVYNSLQQLSTGGHGFVDDISELGQTISLAGSERVLTRIDVWLESQYPPYTYQVHLYEIDPATGLPKDAFWESQPQIAFGQSIFSVPIPNVKAPDTFLWTVGPSPHDPNMALLFSSPPIIGTSASLWRRTGSDWKAFSIVDGGFGARAFAMPEPSSAALTAFALCGLVRRRHTKHPRVPNAKTCSGGSAGSRSDRAAARTPAFGAKTGHFLPG